jgi:hypothetical protein
MKMTFQMMEDMASYGTDAYGSHCEHALEMQWLGFT